MAHAGVLMTVTCKKGQVVKRQFADYEEFLMWVQEKEQCHRCVKDVHLEQKHIPGLDDE